jgi:ferric-dicitrate binding protein FerR (iron transport regulator)
VTITGEAYFEVKPLSLPPTPSGGGGAKKIPFKVIIPPQPGGIAGAEVEVLGTHFNINAYSDEVAVKTTLLEGAVRVVKRETVPQGGSKENPIILKPGEQAVLATYSPLAINYSPDIDQVMAWKNGLFNFNKVSLQDVMKQIARWYGVDIVYQGVIKPKQFGGEIQRDLNLSEVLEGLKETGIHFRIEGKKLIVLP